MPKINSPIAGLMNFVRRYSGLMMKSEVGMVFVVTMLAWLLRGTGSLKIMDSCDHNCVHRNVLGRNELGGLWPNVSNMLE